MARFWSVAASPVTTVVPAIISSFYTVLRIMPALLQCVASHPETRQLFLNGTYLSSHFTHFYPSVTERHIIAHIPLFLYTFLNTTSKTRPFEYLRLTSLGVIGALVKVGLFLRFHASSIHF